MFGLLVCVVVVISDDKFLERTSELIAGCKAVIVAHIGAGLIDTLLLRRIRSFTLPGSIDDTLTTFHASKRFQNLH